MRLLLDTHALVWWFMADRRLSQRAREAIGDPDNQPVVSSATIWEIATKNRLGKMPPEISDLAREMPDRLTELGHELMPIDPAHAQLSGSLEGQHRDPFDRMLAAQSKLEKVPLVTRDPVFAAFGVVCLW